MLITTAGLQITIIIMKALNITYIFLISRKVTAVSILLDTYTKENISSSAADNKKDAVKLLKMDPKNIIGRPTMIHAANQAVVE